MATTAGIYHQRRTIDETKFRIELIRAAHDDSRAIRPEAFDLDGSSRLVSEPN